MRLIDADALINTLQELFDKREKEARFTGDRGVTVTWNDAIYHIKTAPTIEERKTGKWFETDSHEPCWYKCDQCGRLSDIKEIYCPTCGASMVNTTCGANMRGDENG